MKRLIALFASIVLSFPFVVAAQQDTATYIDNLNAPQDSSYMQQDLLAGTETASSGNTTIIVIIVVVVVIAVAAFVFLRKKKK